MKRFLWLPAAVLAQGLMGACLAAPDPRQLVRRAVELHERNWLRLEEYIHLERLETKRLDGQGGVKSVRSKTHEIRMLEGSPFRRLVLQDDKPLPPEEEKAQAASLDVHAAARKKETAGQRHKRIEDYEEKRDRYRDTFREIPEAFTFRLTGEEAVNGRPAWVLEASPRRDYYPKNRYAKIFTETQGRIWLDKATNQWLRVEAELTDTVSFGWILVRVHKGARTKLEQVRLSEDVWFPRWIWYAVSLRVGLFLTYHIEEDASYRDYRPLNAVMAIRWWFLPAR